MALAEACGPRPAAPGRADGCSGTQIPQGLFVLQIQERRTALARAPRAAAPESWDRTAGSCGAEAAIPSSWCDPAETPSCHPSKPAGGRAEVKPAVTSSELVLLLNPSSLLVCVARPMPQRLPALLNHTSLFNKHHLLNLPCAL